MSLEHKDFELPKLPTDISDEDWARMSGDDSAFHFSSRDLYADLQGYRAEEWAATVKAFEENPDDVYNAWQYLNRHPLFWYLAGRRDKPVEAHEKYLQAEHGVREGLETCVVKVNPETRSIDEDETKNTKIEFWYELCFTSWPGQWDDVRTHAYTLDGGGDTYEACVIKAAKQIHEVYGNDRRLFDEIRKGE